MTQTTIRTPINLILAIATILLASVGAVAARAKVRAEPNPPSDSMAIIDALAVVTDSVTADRDAAVRLLEWFEKKASGSSAALINDLRQFNTRHTMPASLAALLRERARNEPKTAAHANEAVQDTVSLDVLVADVEAAEVEVMYAYRMLRRDLDAHLQTGVWHYLNDLEPGERTIDFRGSLLDLDRAGFDTSMRTVVRALDTQLHALARMRVRVVASAGVAGTRHP